MPGTHGTTHHFPQHLPFKRRRVVRLREPCEYQCRKRRLETECTFTTCVLRHLTLPMETRKSPRDLQHIARGLLTGSIFCDWIIPHDEDVPTVFVSLELLHPVDHLILQTQDVGMIYEYYANALYTEEETQQPIFLSHNILTKDESYQVAAYFTRYKSIVDTEVEVIF